MQNSGDRASPENRETHDLSEYGVEEYMAQ